MATTPDPIGVVRHGAAEEVTGPVGGLVDRVCEEQASLGKVVDLLHLIVDAKDAINAMPYGKVTLHIGSDQAKIELSQQTGRRRWTHED